MSTKDSDSKRKVEQAAKIQLAASFLKILQAMHAAGFTDEDSKSQERCKADAGPTGMGCYAKVDADKQNVTAADDVTTGDNNRGGGGVGAPPTRRTMTMTTPTRAVASVATMTTGGSRNTLATTTTAQYQRCWGRLPWPQTVPTGRRRGWRVPRPGCRPPVRSGPAPALGFVYEISVLNYISILKHNTGLVVLVIYVPY